VNEVCIVIRSGLATYALPVFRFTAISPRPELILTAVVTLLVRPLITATFLTWSRIAKMVLVAGLAQPGYRVYRRGGNGRRITVAAAPAAMPSQVDF
jgi:hypothetical protein